MMRVAAALALLALVAAVFGQNAPQCNTPCTGIELDYFSGVTYPIPLVYFRSSTQPPFREDGNPHSAAITTGVIIIHDENRDARSYYCYAQQAIAAAGIDPSTVYIVAPMFQLFGDNTTASNITQISMYWDADTAWVNCGKNAAAQGKGSDRKASCLIIDDMINTFATPVAANGWFPNIKQIFVIGHSSGAQMVQQYAATSTNDQALVNVNPNVLVRYVVMNAGAYSYLDGNRSTTITPFNSTTCAGECDAATVTTQVHNFAVPAGCIPNTTDYNGWGYGMNSKNSKDAYTDGLTVPQVIQYYQNKNITYALGLLDTCGNSTNASCGCTDALLDTSCPAMLQGNCRLQRGYAFYADLTNIYGTPVQALLPVPNVGHDACNMLLSTVVQNALFTNWPTAGSSTTGPNSTTAGVSTTGAATTSSATAVAFSALFLFAALLSMF